MSICLMIGKRCSSFALRRFGRTFCSKGFTSLADLTTVMYRHIFHLLRCPNLLWVLVYTEGKHYPRPNHSENSFREENLASRDNLISCGKKITICASLLFEFGSFAPYTTKFPDSASRENVF